MLGISLAKMTYTDPITQEIFPFENLIVTLKKSRNVMNTSEETANIPLPSIPGTTLGKKRDSQRGK